MQWQIECAYEPFVRTELGETHTVDGAVGTRKKKVEGARQEGKVKGELDWRVMSGLFDDVATVPFCYLLGSRVGGIQLFCFCFCSE
jgi:hypothetical protein